MIGIGNDVFDNFRDIVNEDIKCLNPKEISTRQTTAKCTAKIDCEVQERDAWDASHSGKQYSSLKGRIYQVKLTMKKLGVLVVPHGLTTVDKRDGIEKLLDEKDHYVEVEDVSGSGFDDGNENETDVFVLAQSLLRDTPNSDFLFTTWEKHTQLVGRCNELEIGQNSNGINGSKKWPDLQYTLT